MRAEILDQFEGSSFQLHERRVALPVVPRFLGEEGLEMLSDQRAGAATGIYLIHIETPGWSATERAVLQTLTFR